MVRPVNESAKENISMPLVSVIVPTFNSSKTIGICLESVGKQTYPNIEVIVIDKHSTDDTVERARKKGVQILHTKELRSVARNIAAEKARGEFLVFLDSDITLSERVIEECIEKVSQGALVITFPEIVVGEGFWAKCRALEALCYLGDDAIEAPRFLSKSVFEKVGGFNKMYEGQEDWDLRERIFKQGHKAFRISALTAHHEGKVNFVGRLRKKYYYSETLLLYVRSHKTRTVGQIPFFREAYFRNLNILVKDPIHAVGFVAMKTAETLAAALGILVTRYRKPRNVYE
jgi:glycosyltransferase involved in cell wall biosynthesis